MATDHQVFLFFELRAAAEDVRDGSAFQPRDARRLADHLVAYESVLRSD